MGWNVEFSGEVGKIDAEDLAGALEIAARGAAGSIAERPVLLTAPGRHIHIQIDPPDADFEVSI
jgi:hypothetical protein